jgi:ABC-type sugar transport system ATPase subunit
VADRVTVLKDGRVVRTSAAERESASSLIESMLGRPLSTMFPVKSSQTHPRTALSVTNLARSPHFEAVSLQVGIGEIVGIAGLAGSGRTELARAIVGVDRADSGTVSVGQITGRFASPRSAQAAGLVMIPESRKDQGLILRANVLDNVCLPHLGAMSTFGFMSDRRQRRSAAKALTAVAMDPSRLNSPVAELSGGNQQKVLFAKWLMADPSVVIADEPTRGVDVGARAVIYQTLRSLANQGTAILFISSDLEEVIGFADRVLVMRSGRRVAQLAGEQVTEEAVLRAMLNHDATQEVTTREA